MSLCRLPSAPSALHTKRAPLVRRPPAEWGEKRREPKLPPACQDPKAAIWAAALPWLTVRAGVWLS